MLINKIIENKINFNNTFFQNSIRFRKRKLIKLFATNNQNK
jgi:hypothetical protein